MLALTVRPKGSVIVSGEIAPPDIEGRWDQWYAATFYNSCDSKDQTLIFDTLKEAVDFWLQEGTENVTITAHAECVALDIVHRMTCELRRNGNWSPWVLEPRKSPKKGKVAA